MYPSTEEEEEHEEALSEKAEAESETSESIIGIIQPSEYMQRLISWVTRWRRTTSRRGTAVASRGAALIDDRLPVLFRGAVNAFSETFGLILDIRRKVWWLTLKSGPYLVLFVVAMVWINMVCFGVLSLFCNLPLFRLYPAYDITCPIEKSLSFVQYV